MLSLISFIRSCLGALRTTACIASASSFTDLATRTAKQSCLITRSRYASAEPKLLPAPAARRLPGRPVISRGCPASETASRPTHRRCRSCQCCQAWPVRQPFNRQSDRHAALCRRPCADGRTDSPHRPAGLQPHCAGYWNFRCS